jgi:hypothetical protein
MAAFFRAGYGDVALPGMALDPLLVLLAVALLVALCIPIAMIITCKVGKGCESDTHRRQERSLYVLEETTDVKEQSQAQEAGGVSWRESVDATDESTMSPVQKKVPGHVSIGHPSPSRSRKEARLSMLSTLLFPFCRPADSPDLDRTHRRRPAQSIFIEYRH